MNEQAVAALLQRIEFVQWDRLTRYTRDDTVHMSVYGWIAREDGRSDFVVLEFEQTTGEDTPRTGFLTSSAAFDVRLEEIIFGKPQPAQNPCERVETVLPGVPNAVRLQKP